MKITAAVSGPLAKRLFDEFAAACETLNRDAFRAAGDVINTARNQKRPGTRYAVERWANLKREMLPLLERHWREIALNHADVPLDIDHDRYEALDEAGSLHIVTVRREGLLIGYHVAVVGGHLHYKSTLHGITDVYWIAPECRHGVTGMRMFQAVERELKAIGVRKLFTATKLHLDQGPLFERLGYQPVERLYAKII